MLGAIAGDIIGSIYEGTRAKTEDFELFSEKCRFTDDTILTIAVADCILHGKDYAKTFKEYARKYPHRGYGGFFKMWAMSDSLKPYNSFGNGSAMRVSPVGFAFNTLEDVLLEAQKSAMVTHDHPIGILGAQACAAAIFLLKSGKSPEEVKQYFQDKFGMDFSRSLEEIFKSRHYDFSSLGTTKLAIIAFLESDSFENAIRKAVRFGGDSDTLACITGAIAQAHYKKIPGEIVQKTLEYLPEEFITILDEFINKFSVKY
ncbi:MAG: ADP-ribosylglycohydrolase family protein [Candidatus Omnitrophota bacterium]